MSNSEWDKHLRDILDEYKPEDITPQWEAFARQWDAVQQDGEMPLADETLKNTLTNYQPTLPVTGWERIESTLNAEDQAFDEQVRARIQNHTPPFDPQSWTGFIKKWSELRFLRSKLIAIKTIECAAIILLLITFVNMGRYGKMPFEKPSPGDDAPAAPQTSAGTEETFAQWHPVAPNTPSVDGDPGTTNPTSNPDSKTIKNKVRPNNQYTPVTPESSQAIGTLSGTKAIDMAGVQKVNSPTHNGVQADPSVMQPEHADQWPAIAESLPVQPELTETISLPDSPLYLTSSIERTQSTVPLLASLDLRISSLHQDGIPAPKQVRTPARTNLELGMLTQSDYNRLRMPEDRLYSVGKQIIFPQQGIASQGYGAGITVAVNHPRWALESGIIYSIKTFKPGRQTIIGDVFNSGHIDFEAMHLQLVSVPIQYRFRFAPKGRMKAYAIAGFGMHVITQSDIDIQIRYNFPTLSPGANPNNDPTLAETIRETRRISERIRDGAPFSTKSFASGHAGLGIEYGLTSNKTLFLQTIAQYQIPGLRFSNHNGKHLRSISLQAGVRTPLGH